MLKKLFDIGSNFLTRKEGTVLSAAAVIIATVLLSRILGFVRLRLLATFFLPEELGIYLAAFRLPDTLFEIIAMGAVSAAFIPVFTHYLVKKSTNEAFLMASYIINIATLIGIVLAIPLFIFAKQISYILVPGFLPHERELMISFTRIMLLGQLLPLVLGNFVTGMLQSFQRFLLPALAPVVYNLGIILGIIFLSPQFGLYGAVWGVIVGGFLYLLIQIPLLIHLKYHHTFRINFTHPGVRDVGRLVIPRVMGLAATQVDTNVDLILASFLGTRFITIFNFAQNLQQFPIGLFGATFAQAALPALSVTAAQKDLTEFKKMFIAATHQILFFVLPVSTMLIVLRIPIVRLIYGAAKFDWPATVFTGQTLSMFAVSIFAQALIQLLARGFYALHDTKTPVIIGVVSIVINTFLSITFIRYLHLPVWSLALSTSIAGLINWSLLLIFLYRKVSGFDLKALCIPFFKMMISSLTTGVFLYVPMKLLDRLVFDTTRVFDLLLLTSVAAISGLSVYIFLAWFLDIDEVGTFFKLLQKVKRMPRVFFTQSEVITDDQSSIS